MTLRFVALVAMSVAGCHLAAGIEEAELIDPSGCADDAACADDNPCTLDRCAEGTCLHDPTNDALPEAEQIAGDCRRAVCLAGVIDQETDDADLPVDGLFCTEDLCNQGTPDNPPLAGGTPCNEAGGQVCNGDGDCVGCFSNDDCTPPETCGGGGTVEACGCTPIQCSEVGLTCGFHPNDECGGVLSCNNTTQDGSETDVDCGGSVSTCSTRCSAGKMCLANTDCASSLCCDTTCCASGEICVAGLCQPP